MLTNIKLLMIKKINSSLLRIEKKRIYYHLNFILIMYIYMNHILIDMRTVH